VLFDHTSLIKTILLRFCPGQDGKIPNMGKRVQSANHLGELLTAEQARPGPPQSNSQNLIDETSQFQAELMQHAMNDLPTAAGAPDLTDFQEEFLAGKQELLAMREQARAAANMPPPAGPTAS
jgi:phospholipase C